MLLATSWLTKCAVRPTMETMAMMLRAREMRKVLARGAEEVIFVCLLEGWWFGVYLLFVVVGKEAGGGF